MRPVKKEAATAPSFDEFGLRALFSDNLLTQLSDCGHNGTQAFDVIARHLRFRGEFSVSFSGGCRMPKLTKSVVDAAVPRAKQFTIWCSELKGFGVFVLP